MNHYSNGTVKQWRYLEVETSFASSIGESFDAAMVQIAAAIEDNFLDLGSLARDSRSLSRHAFARLASGSDTFLLGAVTKYCF